MHDEAGRLVDDDDGVVLVDDVQFHRFRRVGRILGRRLRHDGDRLVAIGRALALRRLAVDEDVAFVEPLLQAAARELGHQPGHDLVQPLAAVFWLQFQGDRRIIRATGAGIELGVEVLIQVGVEKVFRRIRRSS